MIWEALGSEKFQAKRPTLTSVGVQLEAPP